MSNRRKRSTSVGEKKPLPMNYKTEMLKVSIGKTSAFECLDIIIKEYEYERSKRQSFEARSSIIITIIAALCIFALEKVHLSEIVTIIVLNSLSFSQLIRIISGIGVYLGFVLTLFFIIKTLRVEAIVALDVKQVNEKLIGKQRLEGITKLIITYREIVLQCREINERKAQAFKQALIWIVVAIVSVAVFVNT